jgi:hypothetical protein
MNEESAGTTGPGPRSALAREAAVLQLKLLADGFRDAALIPISLIAALIGLLRGGEDADREFREVLRLGRRTERWINLFGYHRPYSRTHPAGSLDRLVDTVEDVLKEQYEKGRATREARDAIENALEKFNDSPGKGEKSVEK